MKKQTILLIDDDPSLRRVIEYSLVESGYAVVPAASGEEGLGLFQKGPCDEVITDITMPGMSGLEVLAKVRQADPNIPVIIITAYGTIESAVSAMRQGALGLARKIYLCNTQDLGSRYKFLPMAGGYPLGEEIAGYLSETFDRYGAPLVLKRDNEGNMSHSAVNDVLSESFVLPLNNPEYYAPYNGAIEESQREVKRGLRDKLALDLPAPGNHISAYAEAAVNDLNHRHRPCLNGRTSCQLFFESANKPTFSKRERREIYDRIMEKAERIRYSSPSSDLRITCECPIRRWAVGPAEGIGSVGDGRAD